MDPSLMDKRTKEYKEWAAQKAAERKAKYAERMAAKAAAAQGQEPPEAKDGPIDQPLAEVEVPGFPVISKDPGMPEKEPEQDVVIDLNHKETIAPPVARKPTRPWERKNTHRPWRRDYFNLVRKKPGFRCRFVAPANVEARIQRGYQVASPDDYGGLVDIDVRDTTGLGKVLTRHGMVLMEIPEEGAQAYEQQNEERIQSMYRSTKAELEAAAAEAGTKVTVRETVSR